MTTSRVQLIFTLNSPAAQPEKLLSYSKGTYKSVNKWIYPAKEATVPFETPDTER